MAPRLTYAPQQSPAKGIPSAGIRRNKKTTASKKSKPTRANCLRNALAGDLTPPIDHSQAQAQSAVDALVAEANQLKPAQPLSKTPENLDESPRSQGRKRKRGLEEEESHKRRQAPLPSTVKPAVAFIPLNKKDLAELDKLNRQKDPEVFDGMKNKRSRSGSSVTEVSEDTITTVSAKSSLSLSDYRLITLDRQRIVFQHDNMPEHIRTRLEFIMQSPISEDDKREVTSFAKSLCDGFADVLKAACREDDSVEKILHALESINEKLLGETYTIRRKAVWDPALKPTVERRRYSSVLPAKPPKDTNSALDESRKERQPYITPDGSASTMPPPSYPPKQDAGGVKTPCPDVTIGLRHDIVAAKLESVGVIKPYADDLMKDLQHEKALISCPAQSALLLRFPPLVIEGKSYATGKTLYEAQNQAAVSGSMMLVIQNKLSELAGSHSPNCPLAFSICSEGPVMELWVHYNTSDTSVRYYNMHIFQFCHASSLDTVVAFLLVILRIMRWVKSPVLDDIAEKLLRVWKATQDVVT